MARKPLERLARLADTTVRDIEKGREAMEEARLQLLPTAALCDILTARSVCEEASKFQLDTWESARTTVHASKALRAARDALDGLRAFHFPVAFRRCSCVADLDLTSSLVIHHGKNYTSKSTHFGLAIFLACAACRPVNSAQKITRYRRSRSDLVSEFQKEVSENDRIRGILTGSAVYPGMGTGHPDLYKAFCWRFWSLIADDGGRLGVVLPRASMAAKGSEDFRKAIFEGAKDIDLTMLLNRAGWVFDDAEHRYTIALAAIARGKKEGETISLRGPFATLASFEIGRKASPARFSSTDVLSWNESASLPLLPTEQSLDIFAQLRKAPRLDADHGAGWRVRPEQEMNANYAAKLDGFQVQGMPTWLLACLQRASRSTFGRQIQAHITRSLIRQKSCRGFMKNVSARVKGSAAVSTRNFQLSFSKINRP